MSMTNRERDSICINCWFIQIELDLRHKKIRYRLIIPFVGSILHNKTKRDTSKLHKYAVKSGKRLPIVYYVS